MEEASLGQISAKFVILTNPLEDFGVLKQGETDEDAKVEDA